MMATKILAAPIFAVVIASVATTSAFSIVPAVCPKVTSSLFAQSENSKRTAPGGRRREQGRNGGPPGGPPGGRGMGDPRGPPPGYGSQDIDYSNGNLQYGTGKYTQRENNDGYSGGVNESRNGRSMQENVSRGHRGRPSAQDFGNDFASRMDDIEDLKRMQRGEGGPPGGMRDMDFDASGERGASRMGGSGLLRDVYERGSGVGNNQRYGGDGGGYDDYGSRRSGGTVVGGSSHGRGGAYAGGGGGGSRSNQRMNEVNNERRRYEEFGHRMDGPGGADGYIDEATGQRVSGPRPGRFRGGPSGFERRMGRVSGGGGGGGGGYSDMDYDMMMDYNRGGGGDRGMYMDDDYYDNNRAYNHMDYNYYQREPRGQGGNIRSGRDFYDGADEDYHRGGGGGLLRDQMMP